MTGHMTGIASILLIYGEFVSQIDRNSGCGGRWANGVIRRMEFHGSIGFGPPSTNHLIRVAFGRNRTKAPYVYLTSPFADGLRLKVATRRDIR